MSSDAAGDGRLGEAVGNDPAVHAAASDDSAGSDEPGTGSADDDRASDDQAMEDGAPDGRRGLADSWANFCDALKNAGRLIELRSGDDLERAEGYRFLTRLARGGLYSSMEAANPRFPVVAGLPDLVKIGSDNPDALYQTSPIDGRLRYRVSGTRGSVHYLSFSAFAGNYGDGQDRLGVMGFLDGGDLLVDDDGRFEIHIGPARAGDNWLPTRPEPGTLAVRQFFRDRSGEEPASLSVECLDHDGLPEPLRPEAVHKGLDRAAAFVAGCSELFTGWVDDLLSGAANALTTAAGPAQGAWGDPNQIFRHGAYLLEDHEALLIEFTPPDCFYWNFQVDNRWMESLDYRFLPVTLNSHSARLEPDGSVRIVVAHRDPGVANWMTTDGHRRGAIGLRWNQAVADVEPTVTVVALEELRP